MRERPRLYTRVGMGSAIYSLMSRESERDQHDIQIVGVVTGPKAEAFTSALAEKFSYIGRATGNPKLKPELVNLFLDCRRYPRRRTAVFWHVFGRLRSLFLETAPCLLQLRLRPHKFDSLLNNLQQKEGGGGGQSPLLARLSQGGSEAQ